MLADMLLITVLEFFSYFTSVYNFVFVCLFEKREALEWEIREPGEGTLRQDGLLSLLF